MGKRAYKPRDKYVIKRCVIGLDQSYARTGIAIVVDGKIKTIKSIDFKTVHTKTNKRNLLRKTLKNAIVTCLKKFNANEINVIFERIRTYTQSDVLNAEYLKQTGALCSVIIDTASEFGIESWSADTRAWKSAVLGTSKPSLEPYPGVTDPKKIREVKFIVELGFGEMISIYRGHGNKAFAKYNDDAADAACIALYGFCENNTLRKEV